MSSVSLRALAQELGMSHTTVSESLRGGLRVRPATRDKVIAAARARGYRINPLASALMSEMRRSRSGLFRGVIAILDVDGPIGRPSGASRYHNELAQGASRRAEELGFKTNAFSLDEAGLTLKRLAKIFQSRGIRGIFLLPVREAPDLTRLGWEQFSGIYSDYLIDRPSLHAVCPDHYRAMLTALERLRSLGYKRPGLVIGEAHDARLSHRWEAAYHTCQSHHVGMTRLPPLIQSDLTQVEFARWFRAVKCDVVLAHNPDVLTWMRDAGAKIPETHGFCCLNVTNSETPCAGLDLQPGLLGQRGVELLISQILCNEIGPPPTPMMTVIPALWVDGPTLTNRTVAAN